MVVTMVVTFPPGFPPGFLDLDLVSQGSLCSCKSGSKIGWKIGSFAKIGSKIGWYHPIFHPILDRHFLNHHFRVRTHPILDPILR